MHRSAIVLALLVLIPLCPRATASPPFARGHVLVQFRAGAGDADVEGALGLVRATAHRRLGRLSVERVDLGGDIAEPEAVAMLRAHPGVAWAEVDGLLTFAAVPNDPYYPAQWHLPNIAAPQAWDLCAGSSGGVVAVLDSGCDAGHPDLSANLVPGWNFYDNNGDTTDVIGHGTQVAGTAGAAGNNGIGVAGVAWTVRLMPLRVCDLSGTSQYSTVATALQWAADHGARVANISISGVAGSYSIQNAAQYAWQHGCIAVAAAGNTGSDPGYSASPYLISVSGTDQSNARASFSSYGAYITVAAPAVSIYTTTRGGGYGSASGTSFAAPVTCGVLALELAANPALTADQARSALIQSADDLGAAGWDPSFGYGKVNAYRAVQLALSTGPPPDTMPPTCAITSPADGASVGKKVTVVVAASDDVGVARVTLSVDGALVQTDAAAPWTFTLNTQKWRRGAHTLTAVAFDAAGNASAPSTVMVTK